MPLQGTTKHENGLMFMWDRRPRLSFKITAGAAVLPFQTEKSILALKGAANK
jgi:hypothetical protein